MRAADLESLQVVRDFLATLQEGSRDAMRFLTDDVEQVELPNRLNPHGATSDKAELQRRTGLARQIIRRQRYDIVSELAQGDRVVIEARWSAELAVPMGSLDAGATMKARFAMFFELRDGLICRVRNYDCFDPW
ncbi:nuclear transport factor 2 family protein [Roseateles sp. NT4]|uniref:nuclear transport factor 2 family protein n=1 Tax=Roseateles sp. NT4 TaxID=3453715 RepID=UPI003EEBBA43